MFIVLFQGDLVLPRHSLHGLDLVVHDRQTAGVLQLPRDGQCQDQLQPVPCLPCLHLLQPQQLQVGHVILAVQSITGHSVLSTRLKQHSQ